MQGRVTLSWGKSVVCSPSLEGGEVAKVRLVANLSRGCFVTIVNPPQVVEVTVVVVGIQAFQSRARGVREGDGRKE